MAGAHRIPVTPHLAWELQIQIYAAIPNGTYIEYMDCMTICLKRFRLSKMEWLSFGIALGKGLNFVKRLYGSTQLNS
jgi:bifunctional pyridoxal-dependent enzyme with beta-cystathionase and maltose regulon repressor activities